VLALTPEDLLPAAYLALGRVAADHAGLELSVGGGTVGAALRACTGVTRTRLREMYARAGDLGDVAQVGGTGWLAGDCMPGCMRQGYKQHLQLVAGRSSSP
jgi:hypothetical protein